MTLNGRPEASSMIGARVKLPRKCLKNPSQLLAPVDWNTALVTQRRRWSFTELARSRLGKRLSSGSRAVFRDDASSMEGDQALPENLPKPVAHLCGTLP